MKSTINIKGTEITVISKGKEDDFISLTDIAKYKNPNDPRFVIQNWMRTRFTIEFMGFWEQMYNSNFNRVEFEAVKNEAGSNSFVMTPTKWASRKTGKTARSGRMKNEDLQPQITRKIPSIGKRPFRFSTHWNFFFRDLENPADPAI